MKSSSLHAVKSKSECRKLADKRGSPSLTQSNIRVCKPPFFGSLIFQFTTEHVWARTHDLWHTSQSLYRHTHRGAKSIVIIGTLSFLTHTRPDLQAHRLMTKFGKVQGLLNINRFNSTRRTVCQVNKVKVRGLGLNNSYLAWFFFMVLWRSSISWQKIWLQISLSSIKSKLPLP